MTRCHMIGILVLVACSLLEVSTYPSNNEASLQYLPFYGGGRGQYLEIQKDSTGRITSEKIVSEDKISSENIIKNSDENLLAKVVAANLQNLKTLSTNLLKLTNLGRRTGSLGNAEKSRYKTQLASLAESASNVIKLIEEVDDVDRLFRKNITLRSADESEEDDYVAEEGIGIEAPSDEGSIDITGMRDSIAESKPVALAVIGEHGLAAARPQATAIATSGVAIARPHGIAIAGMNPAMFGIDLSQIKFSKRSKN